MSNKVIWGENKICDDNGNILLDRLGENQLVFYEQAKARGLLEQFIIGFHAYNCDCDACIRNGFGSARINE